MENLKVYKKGANQVTKGVTVTILAYDKPTGHVL